MRRCIILLLCFCGMTFSAKAQYGSGASVIIRKGYNALEQNGSYGCCVVQDFIFFRGKIEIGISKITLAETGASEIINYFAPAVGLVFGSKSDVYLLVGGSSWGEKYIVDDRWKIGNDAWHFKIDGGFDIGITKRIFLNFEMSYFVPHFKEPERYFNTLNLNAGLGIRF